MGTIANTSPNKTLIMTEPITLDVLIKISSSKIGSEKKSNRLLATIIGPGITKSDMLLEIAHQPKTRAKTINQPRLIFMMLPILTEERLLAGLGFCMVLCQGILQWSK